MNSPMILDLSEKRFRAMPAGIDLSQVTELELIEAKLKAVPAEVFAMTQLRTLNLADNPLTRLPPELLALRELTILNLYLCPLAGIPDWIAEFPKLKWLSFSNGEEMVYVTPRLGAIASLERLTVSSTSVGNDLGRFQQQLKRVLGPLEDQNFNDFTLRYFRDRQGALDELETIEFGAVGAHAEFCHRVLAVFPDAGARRRLAVLQSAVEKFTEADSFFADRAWEISHEAQLQAELPGRRAAMIAELEARRPDLELAFPALVTPACFDADGRFRLELLAPPSKWAHRLADELRKADRELDEHRRGGPR